MERLNTNKFTDPVMIHSWVSELEDDVGLSLSIISERECERYLTIVGRTKLPPPSSSKKARRRTWETTVQSASPPPLVTE